MKNQILYTPEQVKNLIDRGNTVVVDIRDQEDYNESHIPGAVNIPDIFYYLAETTDTGLNEIQQKFQPLFSAAGISSDKTVIIYEDAFDSRYGGSCRGYWLLSYLGHPATGILDGGYSAWEEAGYSIDNTVPTIEPCNFEVNIQNNIIATKDLVRDSLTDNSVKLLDNRDKVEWIAKSSSPYGVDFAPRKGRLPGARWIEWYNFMERGDGIPYFKSPEKIRSMCAEYGLYPDDDIILYCFKGARVSNTFVAMQLAGFRRLRNYFGSWNEWSRDESCPINSEVLPA